MGTLASYQGVGNIILIICSFFLCETALGTLFPPKLTTAGTPVPNIKLSHLLLKVLYRIFIFCIKNIRNDKEMFNHFFVADIFSLDFKEKEKDKSKVCFLSGVERKVLSGGYSRLDCEYSRERRDVGPGSYKTERITSALHQTLNKVGIVFVFCAFCTG